MIDSIREAIASIWDNTDIPEGPLASEEMLADEVEEGEFLGKHYSEVDVSSSSLRAKTPLVYFFPRPKFYYLGAYLLYAAERAAEHLGGERPIFWDIEETHAVETLRGFLDGLESQEVDCETRTSSLRAILGFFDSIP